MEDHPFSLSPAPPDVRTDPHASRDRRRVGPVDAPVRRGRREARPEAPRPARRGVRGERLELDGNHRVRGVLRRWQLLLRVPRHAGNVLRGSRRPVLLLPHGRLFLRRGAVLQARRVHLPLSRGGNLERQRRRPTVAVVRPVLVAHSGGSARRVLHGVLPKAAHAAAHAGRAAVLRPRRAAARRRLRIPGDGAAVS